MYYAAGMDEAGILRVLIEEARALGLDVSHDEMAMRRLHEAARKAAVELRHTQRTDVSLPFLGATRAGPVHLAVALPVGAAGPRLDPREKLS